jgi:hypothetical protein
MNWDVLKSYWDYVPWLLEKPAQGFAWLINYAPKTALVVAVIVVAKALV